MSKNAITILAVILGVAALACGSSGGDTVQVGGDVAGLESLLQADPRYADSRVVVELANDASGGVIEWVEIILPDSQCPEQDAVACEDVINKAVRLMLAAPTIDAHPGIQVTLASFLPVRDSKGNVTRPGKPPLAKHTLEEWRALLQSGSSYQP